MPSSLLSDPVRSPQDPSLAPYRRELADGFRALKFSADLEPGFRSFLQATQFRNLVVCMLVALAVLIVFAGLDLLRLRYVADGSFPGYLRQVMLPRWAGILVLAAGTWAVATRRAGRAHVPVVLSMMVMYAAVSFLVGHALANMGIPMAHGVGLLIVMVVFYPCGLTFYQSLAASIGCWLVATVSGALILTSEQLGQHWIGCVVMLFAVGIAAMNGYLREYAMREQYLMRHVLDWDASHDPLTGLHNRRVFVERAAASLAQAHRAGEPAALALIDVDHFKAYNDHHGHVAGDAALRELGRLIAQQVRRPLDLAVRLGGEEFAVFSYGEDARSLSARLQALQDALRSQPMPHGASPTAPWLTVSIGVAGAEAADTPDSLYRRADVLLYRAKAAGRNRIEVAQAPCPAPQAQDVAAAPVSAATDAGVPAAAAVSDVQAPSPVRP